ncbi:hypothetical protein GCM10022237_36450 [Nocardioides ginsengisoli]
MRTGRSVPEQAAQRLPRAEPGHPLVDTAATVHLRASPDISSPGLARGESRGPVRTAVSARKENARPVSTEVSGVRREDTPPARLGGLVFDAAADPHDPAVR